MLEAICTGGPGLMTISLTVVQNYNGLKKSDLNLYILKVTIISPHGFMIAIWVLGL